MRASGPLRHLGLTLGGFVGKGYDCFSRFEFLKFPPTTFLSSSSGTARDLSINNVNMARTNCRGLSYCAQPTDISKFRLI